jgi:hypothetical protein
MILLGVGGWGLNIPFIGSSLAVIAIVGFVPLSSANSVWKRCRRVMLPGSGNWCRPF